MTIAPPASVTCGMQTAQHKRMHDTAIHVLLPTPPLLITSFAVAAPSFRAAPAEHRLGGGVATTKHNNDSRSRKLVGLLLVLPRPHGR
eukprot:10151656-Prorocentrum_lima.AAC.1